MDENGNRHSVHIQEMLQQERRTSLIKIGMVNLEEIKKNLLTLQTQTMKKYIVIIQHGYFYDILTNERYGLRQVYRPRL